jgi:hypothetical protein
MLENKNDCLIVSEINLKRFLYTRARGWGLNLDRPRFLWKTMPLFSLTTDYSCVRVLYLKCVQCQLLL